MRTKSKLLLAGLFALFLTGFEPAGADSLCKDDLRVMGGGWSLHAADRDEYNESHDMIGVQCRGWSAMYFQNSQNDPALGIGKEWMTAKRGDFEGGFYAAAWFGYFPDNPAAFIPVGALRGRWNATDRLSVTATTLLVVSAVHLEWRF